MLEARKSTLRSALDGIILVHMMGGGTVDVEGYSHGTAHGCSRGNMPIQTPPNFLLTLDTMLQVARFSNVKGRNNVGTCNTLLMHEPYKLHDIFPPLLD